VAGTLDWRSSVDFLDLLDEDQRTRLVRGARRITQQSGVVLEYPTGVLTADIIEAGLVRAYQVSEDGRQATIGYLYSREYLGALPALVPRPVVYVQHITKATLLRLDADNLRKLFDTDIGFARALAIHTASILAVVVRVLTIRTLGTVRQRIAFDLLQRLSDEQLRSGELELVLTQEELAQGIGSAREVVSRHIGDLQRAGTVSTGRGRIRLDDPEQLAAILRGLVT
jgi:CRP/FNR family transcriptional regulator, anaerobic regulatory protein